MFVVLKQPSGRLVLASEEKATLADQHFWVAVLSAVTDNLQSAQKLSSQELANHAFTKTWQLCIHLTS
jgi:hypothetical protein